MSGREYRFIFAGGGTGGHLYPAVAVAEQLKILKPDAKILFVGTKEKIEAKVIPALGYDFKTIWISGLTRALTLKNLLFPIKLVVSVIQSLIINIKFRPNVAVGAGAYVSGPIAWIASLMGSKIILMEQNSFPGATNRLLQNKASSIHVSFEDSIKYFKSKKYIKITGNPVRTTLELSDRNEAVKYFSLDPHKKVLLVVGGSLGARSINKSMSDIAAKLVEKDIQILWQTGEYYYDEYKHLQNDNLKVFPFISEMGLAYSACDLLLARAGATTIAEVAYLGLPVIFVPSTNVAANHQYKNAVSIVEKKAGILVKDAELTEKLYYTVIETINNNDLLDSLRKNIVNFSKPEAAKDIALDALRLAELN